MKTIIGAFDDSSQAERAANDLVRAGITRDDISLVANNEGGRYAPVTETTTEGTTVTGHAVGHDAVVGAEWGAGIGFLVGLTGLAIPGLGWIAGAGWLMGTILGAGTGAVVGGLVGALTHVGVPHEDAQHYTEAVRRGSVLLAVRAQDTDAQRVAEILDADGAINIDERAAQYRQEGFLPSPATPMTTPVAAVSTPAPVAPAVNPQPRVAREGETVVPVVEEQLQVGKREVERGGVRVYSHVTERPVQEQVTLHEEHVNVERRPVDRTVSSADMAAMKDRTFEVTERSEEAVIAKQARVVEEVIVGKEATDRTETVRDTVRRTDVEVEQIPGQTTTAGATGLGSAPGHVARNLADGTTRAVESTEGSIPGIQTGGRDIDGTPDTRGITEKVADTVTGDRIDDKTGKPVR